MRKLSWRLYFGLCFLFGLWLEVCLVVVVVVVNVVVDANVFFNMFVACHLLVVAKKAKKHTGRNLS